MPDKITSIETIDETYPLKDETKLRVWIQYPKILENTQKYSDALKQARGIPLNDNELNSLSLNPMVAWAIKEAQDRGMQFSSRQEQAEYGVRRAQFIYGKYAAQVERDAVLLAMTSTGDNMAAFKPDPLPYLEQPEEEPLPGLELEIIPTLTPQLSFPVERRLKRLWDIFEENPEVFSAIVRHVEVIGGLIWGAVLETDQAGFQPDTVDGQVPTKVSTKRKS